MSRRLLLLVVALLALLTAGCGVPLDDKPTALDPSAAPFQAYLREAAPEAQGGREVTLFLVRGDRLEPVTRSIQGQLVPRTVLQQLLKGLTSQELEAGLTTAIPATVEIRNVRLDGDTAVITLSGFPQEQTRGDEPVAFAQIVTTLDGLNGIEGVRFRADDEDLPVPRGDGSLTDSPLDRNDYLELLMPPTPSAAPSPA